MELSIFSKLSFIDALKEFFKELDVPLNYLGDLPDRPKNILQDNYRETKAFSLMQDVYLLGMVDDAAFIGEESIDATKINADYDGILVFGVTLNCRENNINPTRTQLAEITRAFNREFKYTPVIVVFRYNDCIAFANTERLKYKQIWREGEKTGKISLLKDIEVEHTHRGHLSILEQLKIPRIGRGAINSFSELYYYWQSVFSISVLNKIFYQEIISWFNHAIEEIKIPSAPSGSEKHKDFTVRLIARLIFIWFLKELKVVKEELLLPTLSNGAVNDLIRPKNKGTSYYKFVLQNLFFNALNREQNERNEALFDIYNSSFKNIELLKENIFFSPFLNGGLFDIHENDWCKEGEVNNAFVVPDHLFLDEETGLNSILSRYKFTIAENTPTEEEIAVDPEMLGRIFENLLAEQSDDTKDVARNNAGAFYTPRPVVSYMCRSVLQKHLNIEIEPNNGKEIIHKLLDTSIVDIACGSGAFPMGMLEEMMQILETVDPDGNLWVSEMLKSPDKDFLEHISDFIADRQIRYVKKLGLLRNCLFGIDILEYAVEITKLRCWLSLIVEQRVDFEKPNYNLKPLPNLEFKFYKKNSLFRKYKGENLNDLVATIDNEKLLDELVNLENEYFITKSSTHGTKEEIKAKIIALLESVVDSQTDKIQKEFNASRRHLSTLEFSKGSEKDIKSAKKKMNKFADELAELATFRFTIRDYFIEKVTFPSLFNPSNPNCGFDIVIGNPPYVNTKLITAMGLTRKLEEEFGYCDDLYNHFTIRGLELTKKGGILCYITSDTFLTLQSKRNLRNEFLSISRTSINGDGLFAVENKIVPECRVEEIINTPKAFAALVDTAIFTLKKEQPKDSGELVYVDLRKPNAKSFEISEKEWENIKSSKENLASWERVLLHTFNTLGHRPANWLNSHTCDGETVFKDEHSTLLKYKLSYKPFRNAINYAIFSPTPYNCQILERVIKPARPIYDKWWDSIKTSRDIRNNKQLIKEHVNSLNTGDFTIIGLLTDSAHGLTTGDNGKFVGVIEESNISQRIRENRPKKLYQAIKKESEIIDTHFDEHPIHSLEEAESFLNGLTEKEIRELFDSIKEEYGARIFGKGFIYRIIGKDELIDTNNISDAEKQEGFEINSEVYVPYEKGDKEGNRWFLETPYRINWSKRGILNMKSLSGNRWDGYEFYFRQGFCMNNVLNPNSEYLKTRLKAITVNDVASMSMYDEAGIGDFYYVTLLNSFLYFKMFREFFNNTVNIQINDLKKLPIKIPTGKELNALKNIFDNCLQIKEMYFRNEIDKTESRQRLKPIEREIDNLVNQLYSITESAVIEDIEEDDELVEIELEEENEELE